MNRFDAERSQRLHEGRILLLEGKTYPDPQLRKILERNISGFTNNVFFLRHIVEQAEDIFDLLVNGDQIISIELSRRTKSAEEPLKVEFQSIDEYQKQIKRASKDRRKDFYLALKLSKDLA